MTTAWQVQEAKSRLSELMDRALKEGPQVITRHGKPVVRVVAIGAGPLPAQAQDDDGFAEFLLNAPRGEPLPEMERNSRSAPPEFGD